MPRGAPEIRHYLMVWALSHRPLVSTNCPPSHGVALSHRPVSPVARAIARHRGWGVCNRQGRVLQTRHRRRSCSRMAATTAATAVAAATVATPTTAATTATAAQGATTATARAGLPHSLLVAAGELVLAVHAEPLGRANQRLGLRREVASSSGAREKVRTLKKGGGGSRACRGSVT